MSYEDGSTYSGFCKGKKKHGKGVQKWENGASYTGYFKNDLFHDKDAVSVYEDGSTYQGGFKRGERHGGYGKETGKGTLTFKNGDSFVGSWKYDVMHGKGEEKQ